MIVIDRRVPLPRRAATVAARLRRERWPFSKMSVGDSFFLPAADLAPRVLIHLHNAARRVARRIVTERRTENDVDGLRVWVVSFDGQKEVASDTRARRVV